ncbi:hypothetical protein [Paraburkholderia sp. BCC1886]|uniref:hypothetical protein n=1 Tax=Paraburkholderia sp. BCC1886 TaxID=2562670 RepID=UPI0011840969|nr:hypothetical protein [Paraburkholderia sp. BCC1886]
MKHILRLALCIAALLSLTACPASLPTLQTKYNNWMPDLPSTLTTPCPVAPPPDKTAYTTMTAEGKEDAWNHSYSAQTVNVGNCNIDKAQLRSWWTQQKAIVDKANAANQPATAVAPAAASAPGTKTSS